MPEKGFILKLDSITDQIRIFILTVNGMIAKALCQYETLVDGEWTPVVRYDTAHGAFHKDIMYADGRKEKKDVNYYDLGKAVKDAIADLEKNWESYKEKYFSPKKKKRRMI